MDTDPDDRRPQLERLRQLAEGGPKIAPPSVRRVSLGHARLDAALGGGLPRGQLHELFPADRHEPAAAIGLAAILARRMGGPLLWLREERAENRLRLHAPGLAELGLDPGRLLLCVLPDVEAVLRAGADALRCADVSAVVIELWRHPPKLGLTATRRFQLAAEASGVTALLLRPDAQPAASAAATRWQVRSIPSCALEANAPGRPAFELELLKHRAGGRGRWQLEWDRDSASFHDVGGPALSGALVSDAADRPLADILPWRQAG